MINLHEVLSTASEMREFLSSYTEYFEYVWSNEQYHDLILVMLAACGYQLRKAIEYFEEQCTNKEWVDKHGSDIGLEVKTAFQRLLDEFNEYDPKRFYYPGE